jgi:hypothetical protein
MAVLIVLFQGGASRDARTPCSTRLHWFVGPDNVVDCVKLTSDGEGSFVLRLGAEIACTADERTVHLFGMDTGAVFAPRQDAARRILLRARQAPGSEL